MNKDLLTTKQVAEFLNINEKMVYTLISEKNLPATKVTGKWLFPMDLVMQWIEAGTVNYPEPVNTLPPYHGLILIAGSNDLLLDKMMSIFNAKFKDHLAMFGFTGSMGGLQALRRGLCHIASSHLVAEDREEYNFPFLKMEKTPAVVNFCMREQGILVKKGNPKNIKSIADFGNPGINIINRGLGTGTRQLLEKELKKAGISGENIKGFNTTAAKHMDVGLAILNGRADAGLGIKPVAGSLGLDFVPVCKERFDLLISKDRFFDQGIHLFLGLLREKTIKESADQLGGYDLSTAGDMVYPQAPGEPE